VTVADFLDRCRTIQLMLRVLQLFLLSILAIVPLATLLSPRQLALVAPVLVLLSYVLGPAPMDLQFWPAPSDGACPRTAPPVLPQKNRTPLTFL
jgi:hypothetical protein